jgi:hypothetical protein
MLKSYRLLPVMLLVLGAWIATPACAGRIFVARGDARHNVQQHAYDEGYRRGLDRGRDDARHRRALEYERHNEYRNSDGGYRREDGNRDAYREVFRQGFRAGYTEAFRQQRDAGDRDRRR